MNFLFLIIFSWFNFLFRKISPFRSRLNVIVDESYRDMTWKTWKKKERKLIICSVILFVTWNEASARAAKKKTTRDSLSSAINISNGCLPSLLWLVVKRDSFVASSTAFHINIFPISTKRRVYHKYCTLHSRGWLLTKSLAWIEFLHENSTSLDFSGFVGNFSALHNIFHLCNKFFGF